MTDAEIQASLESIPTERLLREYLHRVVRAARASDGPDATVVVALLEELVGQ